MKLTMDMCSYDSPKPKDKHCLGPSLWQTAYRAATSVALPGLHIWLAHRERLGKEDPERIHERFGYPSFSRPEGKLIWLHAASVGEAMSSLLLIERLGAAIPKAHFLMTTGTVTSAEILKNRLPARAMHQYIPIDVQSCVDRFLNHWQPDLALWIESEFWPNLLSSIVKRGIPAALLNARISKRSVRHWRLARHWIKNLLSAFSLCLSQTESGQQDWRTLGAKNVSFQGNMKFAALPLPDDLGERMKLKQKIGTRPVWLFASSHPGEEEIALEAHKNLCGEYPDLLTIIMPRHPARGSEVEDLVKKQGLVFTRRSENQLPKQDSQIYLADTLGELGIFYRLCTICCVGGSFTPVGGHNPIEPALLGCTLCFGPLMENFSEIAEQMLKAHSAKRVQNVKELVAFVRTMLADDAQAKQFALAAQKFAESQSVVLDKITAVLAPLLQEAGI